MDVVITSGKGIAVTSGTLTYEIRTGSWEDFAYDRRTQEFYFGIKKRNGLIFDTGYTVKHSDITSFNGDSSVPDFNTVLAKIRTELYNESDATASKEFGENGFDYITDTAAHSGNYYYIQAVTDTVIASITYANPLTVTCTPDADLLKAGNTLAVPFTSITLTSGKIIAYKR